MIIRQHNRFLTFYRAVSGIVVELAATGIVMAIVFLLGVLILRWFYK